MSPGFNTYKRNAFVDYVAIASIMTLLIAVAVIVLASISTPSNLDGRRPNERTSLPVQSP
jgi:hypothetical protein